MLDTVFIQAHQPASRRLMVVLHGLGDREAGYRWVPSVLKLPWMNYLLVNAPDPYFTGYAWYDFSGDAGAGIRRSRSLLFKLLDAWDRKGYTTAETTMFGFSQGCLMTWEAGFRYPRCFAGLVGISGYVHEPEVALRELSPAAREQRFLITHGTLDPLIPFADVREQVNVLKSEGLRVDWHEFVKAHTIQGEEEIDLIRSFVRAGYDR